MTAFGFNENDAKRIGKVVRLAERNPSKPDLGQPDYGGRSPGVRLLIGQHSGSSWASGSTAVVTVYNGPPGGVASAVTVVAYNHYVQFGSDTNCTNRWVALGTTVLVGSPLTRRATAARACPRSAASTSGCSPAIREPPSRCLATTRAAASSGLAPPPAPRHHDAHHAPRRQGRAA